MAQNMARFCGCLMGCRKDGLFSFKLQVSGVFLVISFRSFGFFCIFPFFSFVRNYKQDVSRCPYGCTSASPPITRSLFDAFGCSIIGDKIFMTTVPSP